MLRFHNNKFYGFAKKEELTLELERHAEERGGARDRRRVGPGTRHRRQVHPRGGQGHHLRPANLARGGSRQGALLREGKSSVTY